MVVGARCAKALGAEVVDETGYVGAPVKNLSQVMMLSMLVAAAQASELIPHSTMLQRKTTQRPNRSAKIPADPAPRNIPRKLMPASIPACCGLRENSSVIDDKMKVIVARSTQSKNQAVAMTIKMVRWYRVIGSRSSRRAMETVVVIGKIPRNVSIGVRAERKAQNVQPWSGSTGDLAPLKNPLPDFQRPDPTSATRWAA